MTIIRDVRPTEIESAYVEKPFDEAKAELEANGYNIISLEQFAELRIAQGEGSRVANYGSRTKEGFLYVSKKGIFLVGDSPILANAEEAANCNRNGEEFYLTQEQVEESLVNSVQFKDASSIPTNRFEEDEITAFAFGRSAGEYGEFLKETGVKEMPVYLANPEKRPFARQAWLHRFDVGNRSGLNGNLGCLDYGIAVRGVRRVEPRSGETVSIISTPNLTDIANYSRQFVPKLARKDFEKGLETFFRK
ncbi:MAG: hypothetical protein Q8Q42_03290 [Nanoarchaeota archaeon]|nr:hypothetical protein [Nanoarchaeota archaeon]